ncbi:hypothetical protein [Brevundimonas sp.]|jgi:hypothetical protein|uniref:hypothetical protein n=1 Tax=Brevundimonas sp. TaxID=1871086 RepID=UPI0037BEFA8E
MMRLCPQTETLLDLIATMGANERGLLLLTMQKVAALEQVGAHGEAGDLLDDMRELLEAPGVRRKLAARPFSC